VNYHYHHRFSNYIKDEMGGTCREHESEEKCIHNFGRKPCWKETASDPALDGRIILKWAVKKYDGRVWTELIGLGMGTHGTLL
jgi:hypothetical protein